MKTTLARRYSPARIINSIVLCRKTNVMKSKSKNETLAQIRRLGLWRENEEKEILDFIEELGLILVDVHKNELIDEKETPGRTGLPQRKGASPSSGRA